jgi:CheY-like chemotaxis protein
MGDKSRLAGKRVLIVDDEVDVLDTLAELLFMCTVTKANSFNEAKTLFESQPFDLAVLDIMGVSGYDLLEIATRKHVVAVMLTAKAVSPAHVKKSFEEGAALYVPKEEMLHIATFLEDILEAKEKGKSTWSRWFERMTGFCERRFGPDWQKDDKDFWKKFPFY